MGATEKTAEGKQAKNEKPGMPFSIVSVINDHMRSKTNENKPQYYAAAFQITGNQSSRNT